MLEMGVLPQHVRVLPQHVLVLLDLHCYALQQIDFLAFHSLLDLRVLVLQEGIGLLHLLQIPAQTKTGRTVVHQSLHLSHHTLQLLHFLLQGIDCLRHGTLSVSVSPLLVLPAVVLGHHLSKGVFQL